VPLCRYVLQQMIHVFGDVHCWAHAQILMIGRVSHDDSWNTPGKLVPSEHQGFPKILMNGVANYDAFGL
jgi:hypothetical protein